MAGNNDLVATTTPDRACVHVACPAHRCLKVDFDRCAFCAAQYTNDSVTLGRYTVWDCPTHGRWMHRG